MDQRQFIDALSAAGRLRRVERQVDWRFELGEITRTNQKPLLFENIKDYPGQRVFTNGMINLAHIGLALGLRLQTSRKEMMREIQARAKAPIPPRLLENGPIFENTLDGAEIDLLKLPVPHWHKLDGGRYLGTWHINVTRDLETGARNVGVYRMQVWGPNRATVSTSPKSDLGRHFAKAEKAGKPLEMAVAIGMPEAVMMAAGAACPFGTDEYDLAGGLQGEAVDLVKCGTVNLEIPAHSEVVIEGFIKPGVRVQDGPYFDYAGNTSTSYAAYMFEATRMHFRTHPIFRGAAVGVPGAEDQQLFSVLAHLGLFGFHGSRAKHIVQAQLLKWRLYRAFQFAGRIGLEDPHNRPPRVAELQRPEVWKE